MSTFEQPTLPEGFSFADLNSVESTEIERVLRLSFPDTTFENGWRDRLASTLPKIGYEGFGVTVIDDQKDRLAGLGLVVYVGSQGDLANLAVDPAYRGLGLGKALVVKRLLEAEKCGITSLHIETLADTNTLGSFYAKLGFRALESGGIGYGPDPKDLPPPAR